MFCVRLFLSNFIAMKFFLLPALFFIFTFNGFAQNGKVSVEVTGINSDKGGVLKVGLYKENDFPLIGKEFAGKDIRINNGKMTADFIDIPEGSYAVAVFQDINNDGKLSTNFLGIPTEPYGFSKNKFGTFGPPDFKEVSFEIKEGNTVTLTINMK